jgi:hypothetical protein
MLNAVTFRECFHAPDFALVTTWDKKRFADNCVT